MPITYESLYEFVREHGIAKVLDTKGKTRVLKSGNPDSFDLIEKADMFWFDGVWHSRADFEKIIEKKQGSS